MEKAKSILYALLAAAFYAVNVPLSKLLLNHVGPTTMAALLYLGAAKTSAYYAVAPFIGAFLSFIILHEKLTGMVLLALAVMLAGAVLVVVDTMIRNHAHVHQHTFVHTHDGSTHSHTVTHMHEHDHIITEGVHGHRHSQAELEQSLRS